MVLRYSLKTVTKQRWTFRRSSATRNAKILDGAMRLLLNTVVRTTVVLVLLTVRNKRVAG
jgi:hypothetical protein